ncbi:uncharacterized protein J3R85_006514 [Psidium guajava]|nr:uncharacterized protein J3R85_006514 [Psidium guajava]
MIDQFLISWVESVSCWQILWDDHSCHLLLILLLHSHTSSVCGGKTMSFKTLHLGVLIGVFPSFEKLPNFWSLFLAAFSGAGGSHPVTKDYLKILISL